MNEKAKELKLLIAEKRDVIPFLKGLNKAEKKQLLPVITQLKHKYEGKMVNGEIYNPNTTYHANGVRIYPESQSDLIVLIGFVCSASIVEFRNHIEWLPHHFITKEFFFKNLLSWYKLPWLEDCFKDPSNFRFIDYYGIIRLAKAGFINPSKELIANSLENSIIKSEKKDGRFRDVYNYDNLFMYKETLEEHFWYLFEIDTQIRTIYYPKAHNHDFDNLHPWTYTIKRLVSENKIDRAKVLRLCLQSSTKGFNNALAGWFFKLFETLSPSVIELIELQNALMVSLTSNLKRVISAALKWVNKIQSHEKLDYQAFINTIPALLNSEVKSHVSKTLVILDNIGNTYPELKSEIAETVPEAFSFPDKTIQIKAAKIFIKFSSKSNQNHYDLFDPYLPFLFNETKVLLSKELNIEFSRGEKIKELSIEMAENVISLENKVQNFKEFNDLLFAVNQALERNKLHQTELLINHISNLHPLLSTNNIDKLNPVFKRAIDIIFRVEQWTSNSIVTAAYYINDFAEFLLNKFPETLSWRTSYIAKKLNLYPSFKDWLIPLKLKSNWSIIYTIEDSLFLQAQKYLFLGLSLKLLSTPTHLPCWIDLNQLIDRIVKFEQYRIEIEIIDWQVALMRLSLHLKPLKIVLEKIDCIKNDTYRYVLKYVAGEVDYKKVTLDEIQYFMPAILIRGIDKDIANFYSDFINFTKSNTQLFQEILENNILEKLMVDELNHKMGIESQKEINSKLDWDSLTFNSEVISEFLPKYNSTNIKALLVIIPNYPALFLRDVTKLLFVSSTFWEAEDQRIVTNSVEFLAEIWHKKNENEICYLFLAASILCNHKTTRELVAELWIKTVKYDTIDSALLGELIGKLLSDSYAPLKRLTDVMLQSMFDISKLHNSKLVSLISSIITNMNNKPITNTKKLLEIYNELLQKESYLQSTECARKLDQWSQTKSLSKLIQKIRQL